MNSSNQFSTGTSIANASAADANGNVFVTGNFTGSVAFGNTQLTSSSGDMFVAKWDATARAFTWVTSTNGIYATGAGIAVNGAGVFVTGFFSSGSNVRIAGQTLSGAGGVDMFVAKYVDTSTGHTPATSSFDNGWATSGGGSSNDVGSSIAVRGTSVFVTGSFVSGTNASIAGQALAGAGSSDVFVAKFVDTSTGSTPATSSFANGWATSGGGTLDDVGAGVAVSGTNVYVTGTFTSSTSVRIAGQALTGAGYNDVFVAKFVDTSTGSTSATSSFANGWATSGGGISGDAGYGIAVRGTSVFVTGSFGGANASIAGQALTGAGSSDVFVAKFVDTSTGSTPATSSFANGWATSGGGLSVDYGSSIAVSGTGVFVTGSFTGSASIAGQALAGVGNYDVFVAKYLDTSTGSTPATSSFANVWATSGGGIGYDLSNSLVISRQQVYSVGAIAPPATFGSFTIGNATSGQTNYLARLTDTALLATRAEVAAGTTLILAPNPIHVAPATLRGAAPSTAIQILDALGRLIATATADASGTAILPAVLLPGMYVVRNGSRAARLVVE